MRRNRLRWSRWGPCTYRLGKPVSQCPPPCPMHQNDAWCGLFPYLHRYAHGSQAVGCEKSGSKGWRTATKRCLCHPARTASAKWFPSVHPPRPMHQNDACCVLVPYLHRDAHGSQVVGCEKSGSTGVAHTPIKRCPPCHPARTALANRFPSVHPPRPMHQNDACCVLVPYLIPLCCWPHPLL